MFVILHALGMFVAELFKSRCRLEARAERLKTRCRCQMLGPVIAPGLREKFNADKGQC